jgi:hypothetical protein
MNEAYGNLVDRIQLNPEALEEELITQPSLIFEVGRNLIAALSARDAAKIAYKRVEAMVVTKMREETGKHTEKSLAERVILEPKVVKAQTELFAREHELAEWDILKETMISRGFALHAIGKQRITEMGAQSMDSVSQPSNSPPRTRSSGIDARHQERLDRASKYQDKHTTKGRRLRPTLDD